MQTLIQTARALAAAALVASVVHAQPSLPTWTLQEDLRIDGETHDLPAVGSIVVGPRGRMAVYIGTDRQIRVFEANGKEAFRFGRQGAGPGEFQQTFLTMRFTGDTLWAFDSGLRRVSFIAPKGTLLRTQPLPTAPGMGWFFPQYIAGGVMIGNASLSAPAGAADAAEPWLVRVAPDSSVTRIMRPMRSGTTVSAQSERSTRVQVVPFTVQPSTAYATMGDRFAYVTTEHGTGGRSDLLVRAFRFDGTAVYERRIPLRPLPVTAAQRERELEVITQASDFGPELARKARPLIPAVHPMHRRVVQGNDGTILIGVRSADKDSASMLIDPRGTPRAWLTIPPRAIVSALDATHLWAVVLDDDDLPSLVRYRIMR
jgi:hypothetical protein